MARVDGHHRGSYLEPRHGSPDQPRSAPQRDRIIGGLPGQPDLPHAEFVCPSGLRDHVVNQIESIWPSGDEDSGRHAAVNPFRSLAIPIDS